MNHEATDYEEELVKILKQLLLLNPMMRKESKAVLKEIRMLFSFLGMVPCGVSLKLANTSTFWASFWFHLKSH
jgi:hypothetical protein